MRSERVELRVMRTMFGLPAAGAEIAPMSEQKNDQKCRKNPPEHTVKFTAAIEATEARGRVARGHTGPLDIDYHGSEDHSLPCAFYESGAWVSYCWCALGRACCFPASPENGTAIRS